VFLLLDRLNHPAPLDIDPTNIKVCILITLEGGPLPFGVNITLPTLLSILGTTTTPVLLKVYNFTNNQVQFTVLPTASTDTDLASDHRLQTTDY